jgi:hypothetical protein
MIEIDLDHLTMVMSVRFLYCIVPFLSVFPDSTLWKEYVQLTLHEWGLTFLSLEGRVYIHYFEFLSKRDLALLSHLFI